MDLWAAAARDDRRGIERCLAQGVSADARNADGDTALLVAASLGREVSVRTLLERGAGPDATDPRGRTPLMRAVEIGHAGIARLLLDAGARIIAERPPPEALREELRRWLDEDAGFGDDHDRTVLGVNELVVRLRGMGVPRGLDISERERLTLFLDDVVRYDREVRELRARREFILLQVDAEVPPADLLDKIRHYRSRTRRLVTTATQLRMERVVLERLIVP
jgi:hypothetical protein